MRQLLDSAACLVRICLRLERRTLRDTDGLIENLRSSLRRQPNVEVHHGGVRSYGDYGPIHDWASHTVPVFASVDNCRQRFSETKFYGRPSADRIELGLAWTQLGNIKQAPICVCEAQSPLCRNY